MGKKLLLFFSLVFSLLNMNAAVISSTAGGGNWNAGTTWSGGIVPVAGDDVLIIGGAIVNLTTNQSITNVTLNGNSILNLNTNTRTLIVSGDFTMNGTSVINGNATTRIITIAGAFFITGNNTIQNIRLSVAGPSSVTGNLTLNTGNTATKTFNSLTISGTWNNTANNVPITISGDFVNNGTFNQGAGRVTFTGATSNSISGITPSTAFGGGITINKGASQANELDVQSIITISNGGLTLTNGTFKLSSASTIIPFTSDPNIPPTAKLWCNGGIMNQTASFDWTINGYVKVSAGEINFGSALNDRIIPTTVSATTGVIEVTGGNMNCTGRISNGTNAWTYIQSGGIMTLGTIGNNSAGRDVFNMDNVTGCVFSMSGGTLIIQTSGGTVGQNLGYHNTATLGTGFTGGTLQMGNAFTPAGTIMRVESSIPINNLLVSSGNVNVQLRTPASPVVTFVTITNNVEITDGILDASFLDMFIGGNWTNSSVATDPLTQGAKTITFNGTAAQTITNTGDPDGTVFNNITFNNTFVTIPQITLNTNVTTQSTLTLTAGVINLNANTLTLGTAATTLATSGPMVYTSGWLYGGTFTRWMNPATIAIGNVRGHFPMGSDTDYQPLWLAYTSALTSGGTISVAHSPSFPGSVAITPYIDATWLPGVHSIVGISEAAWTIVSANAFTLTGSTAELRYGGNGFGTFLAADINASLVASAIGSYGAPTGVTATYFEVNRTLLSQANINNTWYIGTTDLINSPLPIELLSFDATPDKNRVDLTWTTATEINNDFFSIEKTRDGAIFEEVSIIDGAGNSTVVLNYSSVDNNPYEGVSYYRLKQTDFNGTYTYSDLVPVEFFAENDFSFNVYPNPTNGDNVNLFIKADSEEEILVVVFDASGKKCYSEIIIAGQNGASNSISPSSRLSSGLYIITASLNQKLYQKKLIIK